MKTEEKPFEEQGSTTIEDAKIIIDKKSLSKIQKSISDIEVVVSKLGDLQIQYELAKESLVHQSKELINKRQGLFAELQDEYGKGDLDIKTGVFTPRTE